MDHPLASRRARPYRLVLFGLMLMLLSAGFGLRPRPVAADDPAYHVLLTVNANGHARSDKPVEAYLNFTPLLADQGGSGALDPNSIRVYEVNGSDDVIDDDVPFQFNPFANYNATNKARGTLTFLLKGSTAANETRRYHVYFDVVGSGFAAPSFADRVTLTSVNHKGYASVQIVNDLATHFYHKPGGGFATLLDAQGNDWIDWNTAEGGAGDFRGIPNMVHPNNGGYFHPGRNSVTTTVTGDGPLKATFKSISNGGLWEVRWDIFPEYARMTVVRRGDSDFWWLYEGTPGGELELGQDRLTRSNGDSILASGTWSSDIPGDEWLFVTDPNVGRSLYLAHHQSDSKVDGYTADDNGKMTIFGFGRSGGQRLLDSLPQQFTFGFTNETNLSGVEPVVDAAYQPLTLTGQNDDGDDGGGDTEPECDPLDYSVVFSPKKTGTIEGLAYADEDVLEYDGATCEWLMVFDGSAVGLPSSANVDALAIDGSDLYLSFASPLAVPGIPGSTDDSDVVLYSGGAFSLYFDGSAADLASNGEDIDALAFADDGDLLISTSGAFTVAGLPKGQDEDLLRRNGNAWVLYFDGSHNGGLSREDVAGADTAANGDIYLSVADSFNTGGINGNGLDIFTCDPSSLGYQTTNCAYQLLWDANDYGLTGFDAFDIR
ncbi:protein of unknown function [Candidatus Promineifilum breve]|uniref:Uncharacterized protein n=1 Tax=Candidatus Promineifilum breve TaxID=1806508 RepID=A0A170PEK1_9CHLR|nr:hypothetical protein [Candidatus Promineifilum breve]CUS02627.2 protein of unknown function [Candidatus Promineifilum breve]